MSRVYDALPSFAVMYSLSLCQGNVHYNTRKNVKMVTEYSVSEPPRESWILVFCTHPCV